MIVDTKEQSSSELIAELHGTILVLRLNRPHCLNALNRATHIRVQCALTEAQQSPKVTAVVLTGSGRAFCAGGDVRDMLDRPNRAQLAGVELFEARAEERARLAVVQETARALITFSKPLVAAINGVVAGSGVGIALACDYRVMALEGELHFSFAHLGLPGDTGITVLLPKTIGPAMARAYLIGAKHLSAARAQEVGLVDEIVSGNAVLSRGLEKAAGLSTRSEGGRNWLLSGVSLAELNAGLEAEVRDTLDAQESEAYGKALVDIAGGYD